MSQETRDARPFYVVLSFALAAVYVWALLSEPSLRTPPRLAALTSLLLVHLALRWGSLRLARKPRWLYAYFALQCLIIFAITLAGPAQLIVLALYVALTGEAIGVLRDLRRSALVAAGILLFGLVTLGLLHGWSNALGWLVISVPMMLLSAVYIVMFGLQARSRAEAQRLLRELEAAHRQLAEYATRVETLTLAAERRRMARELHDTLAQGLAGLILQLEAADSHLSRANSVKAQQIIQQAMARARTTLDGARQAIADLRAGPLSPGELEDAVRAEAGRFSEATGIPCELELRLPADLPAPVAENALRAIGEGLANAARHARASRVWLSLHVSGEAVEIRLRDDGRGFDPAEVAARGGHYGLIGLRERTRLGGGVMAVESAPGAGTTLTMRLPLHPERDEP